jgi:hypothetical protein
MRTDSRVPEDELFPLSRSVEPMSTPTPYAPPTFPWAGATFANWSFGLMRAHTNHRFVHDRPIVHRSNTRNAFYILQNIKGHFIGVKALSLFFREKVRDRPAPGVSRLRDGRGWRRAGPINLCGPDCCSPGTVLVPRGSDRPPNLRNFSRIARAEWTIMSPLGNTCSRAHGIKGVVRLDHD